MKPKIDVLSSIYTWKHAFMLLCLAAALLAGDRNHAHADPIRFNWAFVARQPDEGGQKTQAITKDQALQTDDQLKFYIALDSPVSLYLIYCDTQGNLYKLFSSHETSAPGIGGRSVHYIPEGKEWFVLDDHKGLETFYLLASSQRQAILESLLSSYASADQVYKPDWKRKIQQEIKSLRRQHRRLTAAAERPVQIGGTVRSSSQVTLSPMDISAYATRISADTFYSRTYTIDHQ